MFDLRAAAVLQCRHMAAMSQHKHVVSFWYNFRACGRRSPGPIKGLAFKRTGIGLYAMWHSDGGMLQQTNSTQPTARTIYRVER